MTVAGSWIANCAPTHTSSVHGWDGCSICIIYVFSLDSSDVLLHNICKILLTLWIHVAWDAQKGEGGDLVCVNSKAIRQLCFFIFFSENWQIASQRSSLDYTWQSGELFCLKSFGSIPAVSLLPSNGQGQGPRPIFEFKCKPITALQLQPENISTRRS